MKLSPRAIRYTTDIVSCLLLLAKCYFYNCDLAFATHYCITGLNMAISYSLNTQIYKSLICCIIIASANGENEIIQEYLKIIDTINSGNKDKDYWKYLGMHNSSIGHWNDSATNFRFALEHSKTSQDINVHEMNELKYLHTINRFLTGDYKQINIGVFASIISTGDIQFLALSLVSSALIHYQNKEKSYYFQSIDEIKEFESLTSNLDSCSLICVKLIMIQATFLKYQRDLCYQKLTKILRMLIKVKPRIYFMLSIFIIIPQTIFGWMLLFNPGDMVRQLRVLLDSALLEFEEFSHSCAIAVPYMYLWTALRSFLDGNHTPNFKKAKDASLKLGLTGLISICNWWENRIHDICFVHLISQDLHLAAHDPSPVDEEAILWSLYHFCPKLK